MEIKIKKQIGHILDTYRDLFGVEIVPSLGEYLALRRSAIAEIELCAIGEHKASRSSQTYEKHFEGKDAERNREAVRVPRLVVQQVTSPSEQDDDETVPLSEEDPFKILQDLGDPWN